MYGSSGVPFIKQILTNTQFVLGLCVNTSSYNNDPYN